jgi:flagellar hook-length control protein FliK
MRLHPSELGALRVQMSIIQGTVSAQFTATTAHAQAILENNMSSLRTSLESHGLNVDQLRVHTAAPSDASNASRHEQNDQERQQQQDANQRERETRDRSQSDEHRANRRARFRMEHQEAIDSELAGATS